MNDLGFKEKRDLFFKYLVLFFIAAGILVFTLFYTQLPTNDIVSEDEKAMYNEFASFDKSKPDIIKLTDTVMSEANKIVTQNASGSFAAQNANNLINEFESGRNINPTANSFVSNITQLLKLYVKTAAEKKGNDDQSEALKRQIQECKTALSEKKINDLISSRPSTEIPE